MAGEPQAPQWPGQQHGQQQAHWDGAQYQQGGPQPAGFQGGYQEPPPQWQQPGYGPQPPAPRKRRTGRKILAGVGGLIAAVIVIAVAANSGGHTVKTGGTAPTAGSGGQGGPGNAGNSISAKKTASVGSSITLSGNGSGEQMSVTVAKVIPKASENDGMSLAPSGDRLYAVQFRLGDTGTAAYSDSPSNGAAVVDSAGQSYQAGFETVSGCQAFPASENIAPGSSGLGCLVFEVPRKAKIVSVQFTLDSGMGPETGQWSAG